MRTVQPDEITTMEKHLTYFRAHLGKDMPREQAVRYLTTFASTFAKANGAELATQAKVIAPGRPVCMLRQFRVTEDGGFSCSIGPGTMEGQKVGFVGPKQEEFQTAEQVLDEVPAEMLVEGIERALFILTEHEMVNIGGFLSISKVRPAASA
jgi:hypothetical protein